MRSPSSLAIGLADWVDPSSTVTGSGASAELLRALRELGARTVPLSGEIPPRIGRLAHLSSVASRLRPRDVAHLRASAKRAHSAAMLGRPTIAVRSLMMRRELAKAPGLDVVIQRGSEMRLRTQHPLVTFEDSTVLQAVSAYPWEHLQGLSERDVQRYAARQRGIYRAAVACCCATHWVADSIVGSYGIPAERVFTVGLGQNNAAPAPAPRDWSTPRYLFVGGDWKRKNGPAVLSAFGRVRALHADARLDVVGGHPRIDQPGVTAHGRLSLGHREDRERLAALYAQATAFVLPSIHEPAGIVYVEAAGAGVASVGGSNGGAATMIGPGGLVVDPLDAEQIVDAMLTLADPDTAHGMGELARAHSLLFTWRKVAERLIRATGLPGLDTSELADFL